MGAKHTALIFGALFFGGCMATGSYSADTAESLAPETIEMKKATPILFVDNVQKSIDFFTDKLGFTKTIEAPYERGLQFAAVKSGGVEVMFQASDVDDKTFSHADLAARVGMGFIYFEVDDFDKIVSAVKEADIVAAPHETSYGAMEIYIREPGGNVLGFAKQAD